MTKMILCPIDLCCIKHDHVWEVCHLLCKRTLSFNSSSSIRDRVFLEDEMKFSILISSTWAARECNGPKYAPLGCFDNNYPHPELMPQVGVLLE